MQLRLLRSPSPDPVTNLAQEEQLFRSRQGEQGYILLYRNSPCVVIGRNQNPWIECDVQWLTEQGLPLLRRISGGGAVWHDPGNLNISFILPRKEYDPGRFLDVVVAGLGDLGLPVTRCARQSLWTEGCKIAGSAFTLTGQSALIHACILVDADLPQLRRSLRSPQHDLQGRFIHSVPAHVRNLTGIQPGLDVEAVSNALLAACQRLLPVCGPTVAESAVETSPSALAKYRSWDWIYGRTAEFRQITDDATLDVKHGCIAAASPGELGDRLVGCRYDRTAVLAALGDRQGSWTQLVQAIPTATVG